MTEPDTVPDAERTVEKRDEVGEEDFVVLRKRITEDDVHSIARATGDENPLHLDQMYARETRFKGRIAHGILALGMMSGAMAQFPGTPIVNEWGVTSFNAPIPIGEIFRVEAVIKEEKRKPHTYDVALFFRTDKEGELLVESEATILLDPEPEVDSD